MQDAQSVAAVIRAGNHSAYSQIVFDVGFFFSCLSVVRILPIGILERSFYLLVQLIQKQYVLLSSDIARR